MKSGIKPGGASQPGNLFIQLLAVFCRAGGSENDVVGKKRCLLMLFLHSSQGLCDNVVFAIRFLMCYTQSMSDTLTVRVPVRDKVIWQKVAQDVGEDLSEFARKAVRERVQAVQSKHGSPWDDLLGSVSTDAPPATNKNVRKAMQSRRS